MNENQIKVLVGTAIFSSGLLFGGLAGYFASKKKLSKRFEQVTNKEILEVKSYYQKLLKTGVYSSPVTLYVEKYGDQPEELQTVKEFGYDTEQDKEVKPKDDRFVDVDVVEHVEAKFNYVNDDEDEEIPRDHSHPYIISVTEFMDEEEDFDKITVTYFNSDGVLSDERDEIVDVDETIGHDCLTKFGVKSDDKSIVYVRNERLRADWEVILDEQAYGSIVGGFREKVQNPGLRRFRQDE